MVKELNKGLSIYQRTNGLGMAGLDIGWYTLRDGRNAFVFVTGNQDYLIIPTRDCVLILTPKNPAQVLKEIRAFVHWRKRNGLSTVFTVPYKQILKS
jgi:hypothetical protein